MFSQKPSKLGFSAIGLLLWVVLALSAMALLQLYWMPSTWRLILYASISLCVGFAAVYMFRRSVVEVGIDEQGAYFFDRGHFFRLAFVRANGLQLIAKAQSEQASWWHKWLPPYRVIYCDSLSRDSYRRLRSFAAQQILLRRGEEAKKRFNF